MTNKLFLILCLLTANVFCGRLDNNRASSIDEYFEHHLPEGDELDDEYWKSESEDAVEFYSSVDKSHDGMLDFVKKYATEESDDAFFVFNVEDFIRKIHLWRKLIPRVIPHYPVKTNNFPVLLDIAVGLDYSYDCASKREIEIMIERGVSPDNIIFADTNKWDTWLKYAKSVNVDTMTFDSADELVKIHKYYPEAKVLLRIKTNDNDSTIHLSLKFGAEMSAVKPLLQKAKKLNLDVIGIAFHVGSGCQSGEKYTEAINDAKKAFDIAKKIGYKFTMLDIGGGFPGTKNIYFKKMIPKIDHFEKIAKVVKHDLDKTFPPKSGVKLFSEPGRYHVESAFWFASKVVDKNILDVKGQKLAMYYLNDGVFGSFSDVMVNGKFFKPLYDLIDQAKLKKRKEYHSVLWGPTCTSADQIRKNIKMPELMIDEWLLFKDMGAYSLPWMNGLPFDGYYFNHMPSPKYKVYVSKWALEELKKMKNWDKIKARIDELDHNDYEAE